MRAVDPASILELQRTGGNQAVARAMTTPVQRCIDQKHQREFIWWAKRLNMEDSELDSIVHPVEDEIEEFTKDKVQGIYGALNKRIFKALNVKKVSTKDRKMTVTGNAWE